MEVTLQKAFEEAVKIREHAYAPYSKFYVSAALKLAGEDDVVLGFNIENASYGATICAERSAICAAMTQHQASDFEFMIVVTEKAQPPCGMCLQVLSEFCGPEFPIYLADAQAIRHEMKLKDFLPRSFNF